MAAMADMSKIRLCVCVRCVSRVCGVGVGGGRAIMYSIQVCSLYHACTIIMPLLHYQPDNLTAQTPNSLNYDAICTVMHAAQYPLR